MKKYIGLAGLLAVCVWLCFVGCGGQGQFCNPGESWSCQCGSLPGTQSCLPDGTGYSACNCKSPTEQKGQPPLPRRTAPPEPGAEPVVDASTPTDAPPVLPDPSLPPDGATPEGPTQDKGNTACPANSFDWQGQCFTNADFCNSTTGNPNFPIFTANDQQAMRQPYAIEFDSTTKKPLFCQTRAGYYYLSNFGYGVCDNDNDGWINIFANQAVTSTDAQIQRNARCNLRKIDAVVYIQDGQKHMEVPGKKEFVQRLNSPVSLVETDKNDGLGKVIELPIYTLNQAALPVTPGSACSQDSECDPTQKQLCYKGNCVEGRRFKSEEINTLTKACIAGLDLNDNQVDDANEKPDSKPTPTTEFTPLIKLGYFVELHFGYYQSAYIDEQGKRLNVWVLNERIRQGGADSHPSKLGLKLPEDPTGFQPDYWRSCGLRDNQQCDDPQQPGTKRKGLSLCWMDQVKRATPSLFQCAVFDATTNAATQDGYFHPDNYGANYRRSVCNITGTWTNPDSTNLYRSDFQISCNADDGQSRPDPSKRTVGWATLTFKPYAKPGDYLAGCIDEVAHQVCGTPGGSTNLTYIQHEKASYGLVRAKRECGPSAGLGVCKSAEQTCTGGTWTFCGLCNTCPQETPGQKSICPNGVWPRRDVPGQDAIISCKPIVKPSPEVCDGQDNDCDGTIDEGLATQRFYPDIDKDGFGDRTNAGILRCPGNKPASSVLNNQDCDDSNSAVKPGGTEVCDGIDNDCDGKVDNDIKEWYIDRDKDGFGNKQALKAEYVGCQRADKTICIGPLNCVAPMDKSGKFPVVPNKDDCCDADNTAYPGQTKYSVIATPCGHHDYNCDGKETPKIPICQCSKTTGFIDVVKKLPNSTSPLKTDNNSVFYVDLGHISKSFLYTVFTTYSNPSNCQLLTTGKMTFSTPGSQGAAPSPLDAQRPGLVSRDWTGFEQYTTSSSTTKQNFLMWDPKVHSNGCLFRLDGNLPKCGEAGVYPAPPVQRPYLSRDVTEMNAYSGPVFVRNGTMNVKIHVSGEVRTKASLTRQPTGTPTIVECR